jgi:hypothetical protein
MKMILKECEDRDGCKGRGSIQSDEEFRRSILKFVKESFKSNIFSKDMMEMHIKYN